ncbi:hypothetical protein [Glaciecola sp. 1036]|uniref:hypothetical protein n=1 Tax=Alteromonadaceae TaxID=72275 RepID=UPI003D04AF33
MKYNFILPLTALIALSAINTLVYMNVIPPGLRILESLQASFDEGFYLLIFLIILLESIIYIGFYFPGQFFAVILVVSANPDAKDIVYLTIAMVVAATLGSVINFLLGKYSESKKFKRSETKFRHLLVAMIHINSLAFFMFAQGASQKSMKVVWLAGLLNLPYYLLLIAGTAVLSEQIMGLAENSIFLFSAVSIWLVIAILLDVKRERSNSLAN